MAQCFLQIIPCQQMSSPLTLPLSTPKCRKFSRYPASKTRVGFFCRRSPLYIPSFLPHSAGWIGIDSCSKLIPQGKTFLTREHETTHTSLESIFSILLATSAPLGSSSVGVAVKHCPPSLSSSGKCFSVNQYPCRWGPKDSLGCVSRKIQACPGTPGTLDRSEEPVCRSSCLRGPGT